MTIMQLLMLGASAFFAYKIYEHIQTLEEPTDEGKPPRSAESFSTFDATTLIEKADEEREKGDLQKALAIYSEANLKEDNNAEVLFKMGYTLSLQRRDEEALEYLLDSIEIDNQNPFAYLEMEKIYKRMGDTQKAQNMRNLAVALDESLKEA